MFRGCYDVEKGSSVEVTVGNVNRSVYTELLQQPGSPYSSSSYSEHNIAIPVFQNDSSRIPRAAGVTDWDDEHSGEAFARTSGLAKCPDLNPLGNLWDYLEQDIHQIWTS